MGFGRVTWWAGDQCATATHYGYGCLVQQTPQMLHMRANWICPAVLVKAAVSSLPCRALAEAFPEFLSLASSHVPQAFAGVE